MVGMKQYGTRRVLAVLSIAEKMKIPADMLAPIDLCIIISEVLSDEDVDRIDVFVKAENFKSADCLALSKIYPALGMPTPQDILDNIPV